jgi:hypothetical protein
MPTAQQDRLVLGARALAAAQHMQLLFVCHSELRAALYGKFACARARHLCVPWRQLPALDLPAAAILALLLGRDAPLQVIALEVGGTGLHRHCCVASQQQQQQQAVALCERRVVIDEVCRVRLELEATGSLLQHKQHASPVAAAAAAATVTAVQWSAAYAEVQRRQDEGLAEAQVHTHYDVTTSLVVHAMLYFCTLVVSHNSSGRVSAIFCEPPTARCCSGAR